MAEVICVKCAVPLEEADVHVAYLGCTMDGRAPRCPKCGQVYISEELANGRIAQLEQILEDK
jgi:NAD-dependent SIR2 family protein deacetylase